MLLTLSGEDVFSCTWVSRRSDMGLHDIIKFLQKEFYVKNTLAACEPTYYPHRSRREAVHTLRHDYKKANAPEGVEIRPPDIQAPVVERPILEAPHEYVTSLGADNLVVHTDPECNMVIIEDIMLALRAPRRIARDSGSVYTGLDFYQHLSYPWVAYCQEPNVKCVIFVVDKSKFVPPQKRKTQDKRAAETKRRRDREKAAAEIDPRAPKNKHAAQGTNPDPNEQKRSGVPADTRKRHTPVQDDDKDDGDEDMDVHQGRSSTRMDQDKRSRDYSPGATGERRSRFHGVRPAAKSKGGVFPNYGRPAAPEPAWPDDKDFPEEIEITDDGIRVPGASRPLPLDAVRIMNQRNLRPKLYTYIRNCMVNDRSLFLRKDGTVNTTLHIVFDMDEDGPWIFTHKRAVRVKDGGNRIGEADLACFWWAAHQPNFDVFIHAGDTDYLAIALLNAHRFKRSLVIQIRDASRKKRAEKYDDPDKAEATPGPVCMEAHHSMRLLEMHGLTASEFSLACIMNGTDYVERSQYLNFVTMRYVVAGVRLYSRLRERLAVLLDRPRTDSTSRGLYTALNTLLQSVFDTRSTLFQIEPVGMAVGEGKVASRTSHDLVPWAPLVTGTEFPRGLDAVVCCIYTMFHSGKSAAQRNRLVRAASRSAVAPLGPGKDDVNAVVVGFLRPILEAVRDEAAKARKPRKGKEDAPVTVRGLPPARDTDYLEALEAVRFNYVYWATLQNTVT